jgi:hypothetical protein
MGGRSFARPGVERFRGRKQPSLAQEGVDILRLVRILGGVKPGWLNERQK